MTEIINLTDSDDKSDIANIPSITRTTRYSLARASRDMVRSEKVLSDSALDCAMNSLRKLLYRRGNNIYIANAWISEGISRENGNL